MTIRRFKPGAVNLLKLNERFQILCGAVPPVADPSQDWITWTAYQVTAWDMAEKTPIFVLTTGVGGEL